MKGKLSYTPIRTATLFFLKLAPQVGLEPTTPRLTAECSTN